MIKRNILKLKMKLYNGLYKVFKIDIIKIHYHKVIEQYICKEIPYTINKYSYPIENKNIRESKKYIWIFWWQGIENAPEIVQLCVQNIKKLNPDCEIVVLSKENYNNYVNINDNIQKKFKAGKIKIAHFSDVLRVNLLKTYGGLWMDATMYETRKIEDEVFSSNYWSIKNSNMNIKFVSKNRWTTYFMRMNKDNILSNFLVDAFNEYYENNDTVCHYLLFDYLIDIAYNSCNEIKEMIDNNPVNNCDCETLCGKLNDRFDYKIEEIMNNSATYIFKLTYKLDLSDNKDTVYNTKIRKKKKEKNRNYNIK